MRLALKSPTISTRNTIKMDFHQLEQLEKHMLKIAVAIETVKNRNVELLNEESDKRVSETSEAYDTVRRTRGSVFDLKDGPESILAARRVQRYFKSTIEDDNLEELSSLEYLRNQQSNSSSSDEQLSERQSPYQGAFSEKSGFSEQSGFSERSSLSEQSVFSDRSSFSEQSVDNFHTSSASNELTVTVDENQYWPLSDPESSEGRIVDTGEAGTKWPLSDPDPASQSRIGSSQRRANISSALSRMDVKKKEQGVRSKHTDIGTLETRYDVSTGETTVKLLGHEYPIDTILPSQEEQKTSRSMDSALMSKHLYSRDGYAYDYSRYSSGLMSSGPDSAYSYKQSIYDYYNTPDDIIHLQRSYSVPSTSPIDIPNPTRHLSESSSSKDYHSLKSEPESDQERTLLDISHSCVSHDTTQQTKSYMKQNSSLPPDYASHDHYHYAADQCNKYIPEPIAARSYNSTSSIHHSSSYDTPTPHHQQHIPQSQPISLINPYTKWQEAQMPPEYVNEYHGAMTLNSYAVATGTSPPAGLIHKLDNPDYQNWNHNAIQTSYSSSCSPASSVGGEPYCHYTDRSTDMYQPSIPFSVSGPKPQFKKTGSQRFLKPGCRLWEFIRNLLFDPATNPSIICWKDRTQGVFRLVNSKEIARIWGQKKGNIGMSYEKLSRAMRYYYKREVFLPVLGKQLLYKFGPKATGWREDE